MLVDVVDSLFKIFPAKPNATWVALITSAFFSRFVPQSQNSLTTANISWCNKIVTWLRNSQKMQKCPGQSQKKYIYDGPVFTNIAQFV